MSISEIGISIKNRRKELKISQQQLADLAGVSINTLYKLEGGKANPSIEVLNKLLEVLGLKLVLEVDKKW
jgi:y4mF family transcriptional regulator